MRIKIIRFGITVLFTIITWGLVNTQVIRGDYFYRLSTNNRIRIVPVEGRRGKILDRNGIILAGNRISFDVMIVPQEVKGEEKLFAYLSQALKIPQGEITKKFRQKIIAPFTPVAVAEDIEKTIAMALEENKFQYSGLIIQVNSRRNYPAAHLHCIQVLLEVNLCNCQKHRKLQCCIEDLLYMSTHQDG